MNGRERQGRARQQLVEPAHRLDLGVDRGQPVDARVDGLGAGGEQQLGEPRESSGEMPQIVTGQAVADQRRTPVEHRGAHRAAPDSLDGHVVAGHAPVVPHLRRQLGPVLAERHRDVSGGEECAPERDLRPELLDLQQREYVPVGVDALVEVGHHLQHGVDSQGVPDAVLDPAAAQQRRRLGGSAADEDVLRVEPDLTLHTGLVAQRGDDAGDPVASPDQIVDPAAGEHPDARRPGARQERTAHALLGAGGAALGTGVRAATARRGTRNLLARPAHRPDAALEDLGALRVGARVEGDADLLLRPFEVFPQLRGTGVGEVELALPAEQDLSGRAVPEAAVDLGAAAHAAAFDIGDRRGADDRRHATLAVEPAHAFRRGLSVRRGRQVETLLEHQHVATARCELEGSGCTAGAGPDHQAGFTRFNGSPGNELILQQMGNAIAHRGPDAKGEYFDQDKDEDTN